MYSGGKLKLNRKAQLTIGAIIIITSGMLALTAGVKYATTGSAAPELAIEHVLALAGRPSSLSGTI